MADVEFQITRLVNLAIGSPEIGAVNFNLLQKVLMELLRLTDLETATVKLSATDVAKLEETYSMKPLQEQEGSETVQDEGRTISKRTIGCGLSPEKADELLMDVSQLKFDFEDLKAKVETLESATDNKQELQPTQIDGLQEKLDKIEVLAESLRGLDLGDNQDMPIGQRLMQMEKVLEVHEETLGKVDCLFCEKLAYVENQMDDLEKELGAIHEKINTPTLVTKKSVMMTESKVSTGASMQDQSENLNILISRLSNVQRDLDALNMTVNALSEETDRKQMSIDVLTEQIEVLKLAKADKTNMEDILAAKADMSQVHRKVSHDHFENKIDQLNATLEDAFIRLDNHEEMWQEEVELLKSDIQNKLDKIEFSPLKDFVNEKLKMLQDKMKVLAAQKREGLAAGSKRRIIRDVQCISCDNESVMKPENTFEEMMPPPPLPSQPSVKPYLAYKLDQVRKQQKKLPTGRNMLHFEEMLQNPSDPRMKAISKSGEHLVNRYVGGSHTTTTPQQRITRTGNFFETWGPIITAVDTSQ